MHTTYNRETLGSNPSGQIWQTKNQNVLINTTGRLGLIGPAIGGAPNVVKRLHGITELSLSNSIVKQNALADPNYRPYCMRCKHLVRMNKVATLYWRCKCGAEHDEREPMNTPPSHFWIIYNPQSLTAPTKQYTSRQQADIVAEKMAYKHEGEKFYVLEVQYRSVTEANNGHLAVTKYEA